MEVKRRKDWDKYMKRRKLNFPFLLPQNTSTYEIILLYLKLTSTKVIYNKLFFNIC